jgi:hypothetical protein
MKKYELLKDSIEVSWKNRKMIREGVTFDGADRNPEKVASFDDLDQARLELQKYESSITELSSPLGKCFRVEEYFIEENHYDDEGEWEGGGDVWGYSKMSIQLVEIPGFNTLAVFNNMDFAESALDNYSGDNEVYLSFN